MACHTPPLKKAKRQGEISLLQPKNNRSEFCYERRAIRAPGNEAMGTCQLNRDYF